MSDGVDQAEHVAEELADAGYRRLFLGGDESLAPAIWRGGDGRDPLLEVVLDDRFGDLERLLASEVLYAYDPSYPPEGCEETLGRIYARALELTGTGDRPIVLSGNEWGYLYHRDDVGLLGRHLLDAGPAAVPALLELFGDASPLFYEGSQDATLGNSFAYRVKDAAAFFVGKLAGKAVPFHDEPAARDAEIARLESELTT